MNTRSLVLLLSFVGSIMLVLFQNPVFWNLCTQNEYSCRETYSSLEQVFWVFPIILFATGLTYFLQKNSFNYWWSYARIAIPILFVILFVVSFEMHHYPHGQWQDLFDGLLIWSLYTLFTLGSLIQLARAYFAKT